MVIKPEEWKIFGGTVYLRNEEMKVDHVDMEMVVHDTTSRDGQNQEVPFVFTDMHFQPGRQKTGWIPNTVEMMDRIEFDVDEKRKYANADGTLNSYYTWKTVTPTEYPNQTERMFNILGRGNETITLPNDLPEEKFWELDRIALQGLDRPVEILSTGIDFELIPKDDFALCRIATNVGSLLPVEQQPFPDDPDHPLNIQYTREFWFAGGKAGDRLEVNASNMVALKNGAKVATQGIRQIEVPGPTGTDIIKIYKNRFHLIPRGSVRFRIEFYDRDASGQLSDTGIGYRGTATFNQWTYGVERI